ncbi:MAG: Dam family site-specific DNA-(adenine-N6)-methyltransferase [Bacillota bacterium]|nr:Dam family site-specific DNA-(adenine-N6)-methyltransferase [Bacillota bacterium]
MEPLLKWAGGKRRLLPLIKNYIDIEYIEKNNAVFYEPFVGGGSLFLDLCLSKCVINDYNSELTNVYLQVKNEPDRLITKLKKHEKNHSKEYYMKIRSLDRSDNYLEMSSLDKAARIIYLNKTCYNGLYRVNSKGYFNVPIGKYKKPDIVMEEKIKEISRYLNDNQVDILTGDFEDAVKTAKKNDVIYFDPPYDYEENGFTGYVPNGFDKEDLKRLRDCCDDLIRRGCIIVLSNNDTSYVNELFSSDYYQIKHIEAHRLINCDGKRRAKAKEVIIYGKSK